MEKTILVTGGAGFIGSHLARKLIGKHRTICVDNFCDYYNPQLKKIELKVF